MTTPTHFQKTNRSPIWVWSTGAIALSSIALLLGQPPAIAQDATVSTPPTSNSTQAAAVRYEGTVASIDSTAKTFTINTSFGEKTVTITTSDSTEFHRQRNVGVAGLQVGDSVRATGTVDEAHSTIEVRAIAILDKAPAHPKIGPNAVGKVIVGTVATVSPTLTITPVAGVTGTAAVTVQAPTNVRVTKTEPAGFDSITVGRRVRVDGQLVGANLAAKTVLVTGGGGAARTRPLPGGVVAPVTTTE